MKLLSMTMIMTMRPLPKTMTMKLLPMKLLPMTMIRDYETAAHDYDS